MDAKSIKRTGTGLTFKGPAFDAVMWFDTASLESNPGQNLSILLLAVGKHTTKGMLIRPSGPRYERIGLAWVDWVQKPGDPVKTKYWERFRRDVDLV